MTVTRRCLMQRAGGVGALALSSWPSPTLLAAPGRAALLTGTEFELEIGAVPLTINGRQAMATGINGQVPAPILRWREGDTVTLAVTNRLSEPSSIHWHGVRTPSPMDGVPGLSFHGSAQAKPSSTASRSIRAVPIGITAIRCFRSRPGFTARS